MPHPLTPATCWLKLRTFKINDEDVFERGEGAGSMDRGRSQFASKLASCGPPGGWRGDWFVYRDSASCSHPSNAFLMVNTRGAVQRILQVAVACSNSAELT